MKLAELVNAVSTRETVPNLFNAECLKSERCNDQKLQ